LPKNLEGIRILHENQQREPWLPPLELKDIQQSLCEYQKYVKLLRYTEKKCKARWFPGGPVVGLTGRYHPYRYEGMRYVSVEAESAAESAVGTRMEGVEFQT
jgi:hypothetical protein